RQRQLLPGLLQPALAEFHFAIEAKTNFHEVAPLPVQSLRVFFERLPGGEALLLVVAQGGLLVRGVMKPALFEALARLGEPPAFALGQLAGLGEVLLQPFPFLVKSSLVRVQRGALMLDLVAQLQEATLAVFE